MATGAGATLPDPIPRRTDPAATPPLLSGRGLVKSYGRALAVAGVDLDIPERAFVTLLGPSGCGKTTILRMIAGFETPDAGSLTLDGQSLAGVPPERRPVNTVFQSYALFPHLTVFENVAFSLRLRGQVPNLEQRVARALDAVHMGEFGARHPHQLSGGQQQRVAVARAIVAEPRLLLLDEPLSALDRKMRAHLQIELKDLQRRLGIAFVYVTHDQEEAFALSDVLVVMNRGRIAQKADPRTVYARPADAFVADFIGGATLVPGRVLAAAPGRAALETPLGTVETEAADGLAVGDEAVLVVRPEAVAPTPGGAIAGEVAHVVYQGDRTLVEVRANGVRLAYAGDGVPAPGDAVALALVPGRCFVTRPAS
ncbi:ABC transporter ATP-binding protein [Oharaeibacter diazotrophicus]|uniref:Spermidine/putrescine transport system ATP-binding protein n=1 Tax=Oharaeibacter diazotrophicus TaxID=1920512 RepID=A0A4R6RKY7_9HYPH|nr:ABC transporter ATP-binding protein [Oharaeibacter diazotrophicus]TDP87142.1 spermidine/putrescine transport system ATP-binding protein [Oharaeibacter diazotrophicus]BBE70915.1 spermidine/putrescine import ATP-binding protein PotA [Pleomorphomonas sp. SM30]GLS77664.1 polyamine-transporting ATPase [Oharaeibacter diazotrophicus]